MADRFGQSTSERYGGSKRNVVYGKRTRLRAGVTRYRTRSERFSSGVRDSSPVGAFRTDKYGKLIPSRAGKLAKKVNWRRESKLVQGLLSLKNQFRSMKKGRRGGVLARLIRASGVKTKPVSSRQILKKLFKFKKRSSNFRNFETDPIKPPDAPRGGGGAGGGGGGGKRRSELLEQLSRLLNETNKGREKKNLDPKVTKKSSPTQPAPQPKEARQGKASTPRKADKSSRKGVAPSKGRKGKSAPGRKGQAAKSRRDDLDTLVSSADKAYKSYLKKQNAGGNVRAKGTAATARGGGAQKAKSGRGRGRPKSSSNIKKQIYDAQRWQAKKRTGAKPKGKFK